MARVNITNQILISIICSAIVARLVLLCLRFLVILYHVCVFGTSFRSCKVCAATAACILKNTVKTQFIALEMTNKLAFVLYCMRSGSHVQLHSY
jgi:hypothetical protein